MSHVHRIESIDENSKQLSSEGFDLKDALAFQMTKSSYWK